jgi:hypothetical protein
MPKRKGLKWAVLLIGASPGLFRRASRSKGLKMCADFGPATFFSKTRLDEACSAIPRRIDRGPLGLRGAIPGEPDSYLECMDGRWTRLTEEPLND